MKRNKTFVEGPNQLTINTILDFILQLFTKVKPWPRSLQFSFRNFPEVRRFQKKKKIELSRPRVNFGGKQKVDLRNFVPEGHPNKQ